MYNCNHQFFNTETNGKTIVVCVFCGQVRYIYSDGKIEIVIESGKVNHKKDD